MLGWSDDHILLVVRWDEMWVEDPNGSVLRPGPDSEPSSRKSLAQHPDYIESGSIELKKHKPWAAIRRELQQA